MPHDVDFVVGIPRSGMLPASLIALYLNKPLTDIDAFVDGRLYGCGLRLRNKENASLKKVLIVDDSVNSGFAIQEAKEKFSVFKDKYELLYLAPIVTEEGTKKVDIWFEILDYPRIFEWNLFHHPLLETACMDIDGVLNKDPEIDDDGPLYMDFLNTATPLFIPTVTIGTLISCRLEKYRAQTEAWLKKYNIKYNQLVLLNLPDKATRVKWNKHGEWKADFYKKHKSCLFIESSISQAQKIADISQKPVFCLETNKMVTPCLSTQVLMKTKHGFISRFPSVTKLLVKFKKKLCHVE